MEMNPFASPTPVEKSETPPPEENNSDYSDMLILIFFNIVALANVPVVVAFLAWLLS